MEYLSYRLYTVGHAGLLVGYPPRHITNQIIKTVAEGYKIPLRLIYSSNRDRKVVRARYAAMRAVWILKPNLSSTQIGKKFRRHHATVLYALNCLTERRPSV